MRLRMNQVPFLGVALGRSKTVHMGRGGAIARYPLPQTQTHCVRPNAADKLRAPKATVSFIGLLACLANPIANVHPDSLYILLGHGSAMHDDVTRFFERGQHSLDPLNVAQEVLKHIPIRDDY